VSRLRVVLTVVGLGVAGLGLVAFVSPGVVAGLPLGRSVFLVVGVLAAVQAVRYVQRRRRTPVVLADLPDTETEQRLPTPGDDFDAQIAGLSGPEVASGASSRRAERIASTHDEVRERLRSAAVETLVRTRGYTRERAKRSIETGEWTDDPYAAAFFTGQVEGLGVTGLVGTLLDSEPRFQRRARHAARAVADLSTGEPAAEGEP
jgi:hypothetical protein